MNLKELPTTVSQIELPESEYIVRFVYLSGDRLYTAADENLYVYSLSDHTTPLFTYQVGERCRSGLITGSHLYLGGGY